MSTEERTNTVAVVTVVLEVPAGTWGPDCPLSQVYKQARESAVGEIRQAIHKDHRGWRIVGEPQVKAITTQEVR